MARRGLRFWLALLAAAAAGLVVAALFLWRDDILEAFLDPQVPYTVYRPPAAPNYAKASAWDQLPKAGDLKGVDVFFVHPTTFDGGKDWNGPIADSAAADLGVALQHRAARHRGENKVHTYSTRPHSAPSHVLVFSASTSI